MVYNGKSQSKTDDLGGGGTPMTLETCSNFQGPAVNLPEDHGENKNKLIIPSHGSRESDRSWLVQNFCCL